MVNVPEERMDSRYVGSRMVVFQLSPEFEFDRDYDGGKKTNVKQNGQWLIDRGTGALSVGSCWP